MSLPKREIPRPPPMNPYIFTVLLAFFGLWCFYDGWLTSDPDMQKHALFNQVLSLILLPWSVYDFFKIRKARQVKESEHDPDFQ